MTGGAPLQVAVVGAGAMGANHARVLSGLPGVRLAAVVDPDLKRAAALAERHGADALASPEQLLGGRCDAVVVAAASSAHAAVAEPLLAAGLPCLVEKPLAMTRAECLALIAAAERSGAPLAVGHVERFNPGLRHARALLEGRRIDAIDARRLNPGSARIADADVVIDLMVHDVDAALHLSGLAPVAIAAAGTALARPGAADHATALLTLGRGDGAAVPATLTASRIARTKVRELLVHCDLGQVTIAYMERRATLMPAEGLEEAAGRLPPAPDPAEEPLAAELGAFLGWVRRGAPDPSLPAPVTGADALRTLEAVWAIQARLAEPARAAA